MEVGRVLRPVVNNFPYSAAFEVTRERIEDELDSWTARAGDSKIKQFRQIA